MKVRRALIASLVLGLIALTPALAIVALGLYGSALGGNAEGSASSAAAFTVEPSSGPPGSPVRIEGHNWPPGSTVRLMVSRAGGEPRTEDLSVELATVLTSRRGSFQLELVIPAALVTAGSRQLQLAAVGTRPGESEIVARGQSYEIEPYRNELQVGVTAPNAPEGLAGARVEVINEFGVRIAEAATPVGGRAVFTGLNPGQVTVRVLKTDFAARSVKLDLPPSGSTTVAIELSPSPGRRLYLPFVAHPDGRTVRISGIDLASGTRSDLTLEISNASLWMDPASLGEDFKFFFLMPDEPAASASAPPPSPELRATLTFLGRAQRDFASPRPSTPWSFVWYVGKTGRGGVMLLRDSGFHLSMDSTLYVFEPNTGKPVLSQQYRRGMLLPIISQDGQRFYAVDTARAMLNEFDLESGRFISEFHGLPDGVFRAVLATSGRQIYLLTTTGAIYRLDLERRAVEGPIAKVPGANWLAPHRDGKRLFLVGPALGAMAIVSVENLDDVAMIPLERGAYWVWADPNGRFVFAGWLTEPVVTVVDSDKAEVVERLDLAE